VLCYAFALLFGVKNNKEIPLASRVERVHGFFP